MADTERKQPSWRTDKRSSSERGYGTAWRKARNAYLQQHPLCVMCKDDGKLVAAQVVDHIIPHKGGQTLFWDSAGNWQALCKPHHNSDKQMLEKSGRTRCKFDALGKVIW